MLPTCWEMAIARTLAVWAIPIYLYNEYWQAVEDEWYSRIANDLALWAMPEVRNVQPE